MSTLDEIGAAVKAHRKQHRLTQQGLASEAGISRALLAELEAGRLPEIGFKKLLRVLNAVGLDLRLTDSNMQRPTLEDLLAQQQEEDALEQRR